MQYLWMGMAFKYIYFLNAYISVNAIFESCLFFGWEIGHPLSTYATGGIEGGHKIGHKIGTKWMSPQKCGIFFVHWLGQVH